jgi:molecular chaperone HscB
MTDCPHCGVRLGSLLVCESCDALLDPPADATPFALLGLPLVFEVDGQQLKKRLLALSRRLHPDFFGDAAPGERARAERSSAALNAAHRLLSDDVARADFLIGHLGGPREDQDRAMPPEFLQEVLEWNEAIEEAREAGPDSPAAGGLGALAERLTAERRAAIEAVARLLAPPIERGAARLTDARKQLNAIRYLDRSRRDIAELSLERA